jgi:hypothetical protein
MLSDAACRLSEVFAQRSEPTRAAVQTAGRSEPTRAAVQTAGRGVECIQIWLVFVHLVAEIWAGEGRLAGDGGHKHHQTQTDKVK